MQLKFYTCPKCGTPEVCWSADDFCGRCERKYQEEKEADRVAELKEVTDQLREHSQECECSRCTRLYAKKLSLEGHEDRALALLNQ
tara:strand:- start:1623 stop:1880 length:258 start_codon:yes stop_codon:yes gene_type:complete